MLRRVGCLIVAGLLAFAGAAAGALVSPYNVILGWDAGTEAGVDSAWDPHVNPLAGSQVWSWSTNAPVWVMPVDDPVATGLTAAFASDNSDAATLSPANPESIPTEPTSASTSFELWVRPHTLTGGPQLLLSMGGKIDGTSITLEDDVLRFQARSTNVRPPIDTSAPPDGVPDDGMEDLIASLKTTLTSTQQFYHVVATLELGGTNPLAALYVDGVRATPVNDGETGLFKDESLVESGAAFVQVPGTQGANPVPLQTIEDGPGAALIVFDDWAGTGAGGLLRRTGDIGGTSDPAGGPLYLNDFSDMTFHGEVAAFNIYSRALSTGQVAALYRQMTLNQDLALVRPPEDGLVLNHDAAAGALTGGSVWENNSLTRPETTNGTLPSKALDWTFGVMDDSNLAIGTASAYPGITAAFVFSAATGSDDGALSYTRSDGATRDSLSEIVGQGIDRSSASIESWFRPTDLSGKEVLFETGGTTDGTSLRLNGAVLEFAVRHGNNSDPGARDGFVQFDLTGTPTNEFIQAVGVIDLDGDRLRIFVNGLPRAESVFLGDDWDGGDAARLGGVGAQLGGGQGSGFGGYDGEMAILRIYDRALGDGAVVSNFLDVVGDSVNVPPVDIDLAGDAVAENQPAGTTVGTLSAVDANPGDMHTFSLVPGAGGVDNGLFSISGAVLQTSAVLDYDTQPSASIRVRATDAGGLSTEKAFELRVENLNEVDIAAQVHPNVIIYMCDDMGIGWASPYQGVKLGPAGAPIGKVLRTPQLDRLAAMGTLFTDVHTASSMCSPSRYALLTGRYAWRSYNKHFVVGGWTWPPMIAPERPTMATLFGQHGYRTAAFGKWHLGLTMLDTNGEPAVITGADEANWNKVPVGMLPGGGFVTNIYDGPCQHGFDYYFGIGQNHRNDVAGAIKAFIENNSIQGVPTWNGAPPQRGVVCQGPGVADWDQKRMGEQYMNKALDYLDAHASSGTNAPFFFYFAPNANHAPADPAVNIVVQGQSIPIKDRSRYSDGTVGDRRTDMIYENNVAVGLLLDKLSALNDPRTGRPMVDSTLFIFTSDNGPDAFGVGQAGLRDRKQSLYEGGHRVPFIVSWPDGGVPTGTVSFSRRRQRQK